MPALKPLIKKPLTRLQLKRMAPSARARRIDSAQKRVERLNAKDKINSMEYAIRSTAIKIARLKNELRSGKITNHAEIAEKEAEIWELQKDLVNTPMFRKMWRDRGYK